MGYVCRMCGMPWADSRLKPCACWWGVRIWADPRERFVCAHCGARWPEGHKPCICWPNGVRIREAEAGQQGFPLPGI